MSKHSQHAENLTAAILDSLKNNGLLQDDSDKERLVSEELSKIIEVSESDMMEVETKDVTILLSDIRGFSEISESFTGIDVVSMLNRYFQSMGNIIEKHGGSINNIMGDAILVIFGLPERKKDDVERALACAVDMQLAMTELNKENQTLSMPDMFMGIAVNSGAVVAAEIGSSQYKEYTVIGDEVNITSRIETHCLRGQILISEGTYSQAEDFVEVGERSTIEVKGVRKAVDLYELHATLRPEVKKVPRREKRESPRIQVSMPVSFQTLSGKIVLEEKHDGEVLDISYNGLLIKTSEKLAESSEIKMSLAMDLFSDNVSEVYARIIRSFDSSGGFSSSLEFTTISRDAQNAIRRHVDMLIESKRERMT